jgi:enterochelin esterase-like enzyme
MNIRLHRRHWLGLGLGLSASGGARALLGSPAEPAPPKSGRSQDGRADAGDAIATAERAFEVLDLKLDGSRDLARRAVVLVPRDIAAGSHAPLLVLLHGLGETKSEDAGVRAWIDRYGLVTSYARLKNPPVAPETRRGDLTALRAREINDELSRRPFAGNAVLVCPFTPNIWRLPEPHKALDRYADWIADVLLPEVRAKTPADPSPARAGIDGCSLGGFIGLEVFLRKPQLFAAWGGVQSALGEGAAPSVARRLAGALASAGARRLHVETSTGDAFYRGNLALSRELEKKGVPHDLSVLPGPHDQPFLREAGTLEMLLWHDRALSGS